MSQFPVVEAVGIPVVLIQTTGLCSAFPQNVMKLRLYLYGEWAM